MDKIIKDFASWKLFEATETQDPAALYKAGDRAGLIALAKAGDSADVKSKPGYEQVMTWWTNGKGKLGLFKSIVKSGSSAENDTKKSLASAYYWAGSTSNVRLNAGVTTLLTAMKAAVANKAKVDAWIATKPASAQARYSTAWMDSLQAAIDGIEASQKAGLLITATGSYYIFPPALKDDLMDKTKVSDSLASEKPDNSIMNQLAQFKPAKKYSEVDADKSNTGTSYWKASVSMKDSDKLAILDAFAKKAEAYAAKANKQKPGSMTLEQAIETSTSLWVMPQNVAIATQAAPEQQGPKVVTSSFMYPANPNGDENSEAFKKGLQLFPDDGTTIGESAKAELAAAVKDAVAQIQSAGGKITGVKTYAYSSTSQVPTKYGSDTNKYDPANNVKLANDRLAAINTALAAAISGAGVQAQAEVDATKNTSRPNSGPAWGDAQRKDPKYGKIGARTPEYEATYGKWRYAAAFFEFTYEVTTTIPQPTAPTATPSGTWKFYIGWADESITIKINPPRIGGFAPIGGGRIKNAGSTACPIF
jgi:hypothetical protein